MYEFALTGTLLIVAVYLVVLLRYDLRFLGSFITGLVVLLLGGAALGVLRRDLAADGPAQERLARHPRLRRLARHGPLRPRLRPVGAAAHAGAARAQDAPRWRTPRARRSRRPRPARGFLRTLPGSDALESLAYRFAILGFIFWTFTLIAGSIWANDAWGRYWGFDTKEVWTFVIWVLYAGYIHARATRGWRGSRSAWLSIIGFTAVMFNFTIVNMFFKGLHAYSGLS